MEHERFPEKVTAWGCVLKKGQVMGWEHHTDLMVVDDQLMHKPRVAEAGMLCNARKGKTSLCVVVDYKIKLRWS